MANHISTDRYLLLFKPWLLALLFIAKKAEKLFGDYTLGTVLILQVCSRYSGADKALSLVQLDILELG